MLANGALRPAFGVAAFVFLAASACSSTSSPPAGEDGGSADGAGVDATAGGADTGSGGAEAGPDAGPGDATADSTPATEAGGADGSVDGAGDAASGIVVTSPAFGQGQTIPNVYTCAGADTSPEIDWTGGPATAQSYAVVVSDLTATANIHWVIWDLPPATRSLPATLPGDPTLTAPPAPVSAKQVDLRTNPDAGTTMNGYFGPCPRGALHSYEFAVHAIDVATLPGVTTSSRSADVKAVVLQHAVATGTLTGTSDAGPPADAGSPTDASGQ